MPSSVFDRVLDEHRLRLERVSERRGVAQLKRLYDEAQAEVARKLAKTVRAGRGASFTAYQQRQVLFQLRHGQIQVMDQMKGELSDAAREAQIDSLHALVRDLSKLEQHFTGSEVVLPIEDAARFAGVIDKGQSSLMRRYEPTMARYGARLVGKMEQEISRSLLAGETPTQTIDRVQEVADVEWAWGERIVRTELAHAANATHADGMKEALDALPDLYMQWREFVTDGGKPLDTRVGVDSLAMHLQIAKPGSMFVVPPRAPGGQPVNDSLAYEQVAHPPNRPNDRAVVVPWRAAWGEPGWRWVSGRRVSVR